MRAQFIPTAVTPRLSHSMLTEESLREIIAKGESFVVELKGEEAGPLADAQLLEAVVCQANGRGGVLLIGVEDDGRVTGARARHGSYTDPRRVESLIASQTVPSCPVECSVVTLDGRDVLVVEIPPGRPVTSTSAGVYKRRAMDVHGRPRCLPFLAHEMQSREASRGALDYSSLVVPEAKWEDLDPLEIERLRQMVARNRGRADASLLELSDHEIVRALGLGESSAGGGAGGERVDRVRVAGLLLLGREEAITRLVPTHEVAFQVLSGTRIAVNEFFRLPLIRAAEEMSRRFDARNEEEEIALGPVRVGIPNYSPSGFREAFHNALIHRDYTRLGAVHVQWKPDEIEVSSPGGFPDEVRLDNILVTAPRPRNPVLADAFKRIGLVERTGRGIDTIFEGQLRYGRPAPDYSRSTPGSVQLVLAGGAANLALARFIMERDSQGASPGQRVTVDEMLVVNAVDRERRLELARAAELVQRSEPATRAILERLVEAGVLEARSERRERVYHFSAATYRALGRPAEHVRLTGIEPIQREQMILQFVDSHGRITRSQAADLCQIGGREARSILERLVNRGDLVVRGEKRGAYYERSDADVMATVQKL
ncbi:MAG TPA: ATP-binding protein [Gemmatimonadaceae bacterium]|nr:ATP-binding protein [Gemmatimonadaceae bacterium]